MLDYPALIAVATVVREGSFERAAERLGITPSAVSQRVRGLEDRLGSIVIVRGQPCRATELGQRLCAHVDRVQLLEADLAPDLSFEGKAEGRTTLKVAVNSDSIATWFPDAAAKFARTTGILLEFIIEDEAHTAERLRSGEVLAAVSADPGTVQGCKSVELGQLQYLACCTPEFGAKYFAAGINERSLAVAPCLRFERRDGLQDRWVRETHGVKLDAPMHAVPSSFGFLNFVMSGMAWGMLPGMLAKPRIAEGRLRELSKGAPLSVSLYWTVARLHASSLKVLTDLVRQGAATALV